MHGLYIEEQLHVFNLLFLDCRRKRNFGQASKGWSEKLKSEGLAVIEQLGNAVMRLEIERDNILAN